MCIQPPLLCVIADFEIVGDERIWLSKVVQISKVADSNVHIQIRIRNVAPLKFQELARQVRDVVPGDVLLVLNGDPILSERLGYVGAHYREPELCAGMSLPDLPIRSAAVHSTDVLRKVEELLFSYFLYSPIFKVSWKPVRPKGIGDLHRVCSQWDVPIVALGGIDLTNAIQCLEAGAAGIGVTSAVMGAKHSGDATRKLLDQLQHYQSTI